MRNGKREWSLLAVFIAIAQFLTIDHAQAATYNVTTNADSGAGSLRNAVSLANGNAGADQITFNNGLGIITLTSGQIDITGNLTILGPAAGQVISGGEDGRIFGVTVPGKPLVLHNLTLKLGATDDLTAAGDCTANSGQGGAVCTLGDLTLSNSTVTNNYTINADGGGIYVENGVLTLINSTLSDNNIFSPGSPATGGGGVYITNGFVSLTNSRIGSNGTWGEHSPGGGLYLFESDLDVVNSTISANVTVNDYSPGGGVYVEGGSVTLANSTISGNTTALAAAQSFGGALYIDDGDVTLRNSTITDNSAAFGNGIWMETGGTNRTLTLRSTILAANGSDSFGSLVGGSGTLTLNATYSLYGDAAVEINGNSNGTVFSNAPGLAPLANYGCALVAGAPGSGAACVQTHALNAGSPAINAGSNPLALTTDQRGTGYARNIGGQTDIGAFENGPGQLRFSVAGYFVAESGPTATITVSRVGGSSGAVSVDYSTDDLTAVAGSDYTATAGTLNWADGDIANKSFNIPIANDAAAESGEDVTLYLNNPTGGATLGNIDTASLRINDDDGGAS